MSSTFVADSTVDGKSDDTLIIFVNADGTISVDPDTLNRLLANQHHTSGVSVVRLGEPDDQNEVESESADCSDVNLTVEGFYPPGSAAIGSAASSKNNSSVSSTSATKVAVSCTRNAASNLIPSAEATVSQSSDVPPLVPVEGSTSAGDVLVDPFSEMDPDQLKRLENALQSEHAKQILGENVTAMFDMLKVDSEGETALNDSIRMDHCYTKGPSPPTTSTPITSSTSVTQSGTQSLTQVVAQVPTQGTSSSQVTVIRGRAKIKGGTPITTSTISTASKNKLNAVLSGASLVPVLRPLILPAGATQFATVHTISGNLAKGQRLILPQNQVIVAQDVGTDLNKKSITIATFETPKKKPTVNRGRNIRGGRIRGEGRRSLGGRVKGAGAGKNQVSKINDELAATLEALQTSPPSSGSTPEQDKPIESPGTVRKRILKIVKKTPDDGSKNSGGEVKKGPRQTKLIEHMTKIPSKLKLKTTKKIADSTTVVNSISPEISSTVSPQASVTGSTSEVSSFSSAVSTTQLPTISSSATATPETGNAENSANSQQLKKYPKREHRKPPAHLAEALALGPALFSTPDIIRRVSTDKPCAPTTPGSETTDVGPESLLDNIHSQVTSQDDLLFEAGNLLLEDLSDLQEATEVLPEEDVTGIVDIVTSTETVSSEMVKSDLIQSSNNLLNVEVSCDAIQMELDSSCKITDPSLLNVEVKKDEKQSSETSFVPAVATTPSSRKLPPVELPATRSASKRATKHQHQQQPHQPDIAQPPTPQLQPQVAFETSQSAESSPPKTSAVTATRGNRKASAESKSSVARVSTSEEEFPTDDDDEDYNSEDDPDRLWCICQKPHNNRFMICCDGCEEWFHGKCVGITKAIGKQIEQQGVEWRCPNCKVKTDQDQLQLQLTPASAAPAQAPTPKPKPASATPTNSSSTAPAIKVGPKPQAQKTVQIQKTAPTQAQKTTPTQAQKTTPTQAQKTTPTQAQKTVPAESKTAGEVKTVDAKAEKLKETKSPKQTTLKFHFDKNQSQAQAGGAVYCIVCKKSAIPESIYCSDECIVKHGEESLEFITKERGDISGKSQSDSRVIVAERKTGRLIAGPNAPLASNLISWLKNHPTYEIVRPSQLPTSKFYSQPKPSTTAKPNTPQPSKALKNSPGTSGSSMKQATLASKPGSRQIIISPKPPVVKSTKIVLIQPKPQPPALTKSQVAKLEGQTESSPTVSTKKEITESSENKKTSIAEKKPSQKQNQLATGPPKAVVPTPKRTQRRSSSGKEELKSTTPRRKSESEGKSSKSGEESSKPEPIRLNVKKTLHELLLSRVKEAADIAIEEEAVVEIAQKIEEELFSLFKDTGTKYKSKYRSIIFNIKDPKNLTLFRQVAEKSISPQQLVRLSPEEMANQELAQWREREVRHQLEMIKKNELELLHQAKTVVMKTHKGEQIIEADEIMSSKPEASLTELELSLNSDNLDLIDETSVAVKESVESIAQKEEKERSGRSSSSSSSRKKENKESKSKIKKKDKKHGHKDRSSRSPSRGRKRHRSRSNERSSSTSRHSRSKSRHSRSKSRHSRSKSRHSRSKSSHSRSKSRHSRSKSRPSRSLEKKTPDHDDTIEKDRSRERSSQPVDIDSPFNDFIEEELMKGIEENEPVLNKEIESDLSDREPSSTVNIKTPPYIEEKAVLWKGNLVMNDVAKFETSILEVSGDCEFLSDDLPRTIDCVGRIHPDTVWDYISKMKKSGTKQIVVVRLAAESEEEKVSYLSLYSYLSSRNRMGVVGNNLDMIKDFYIYPLGSHSPIPQVLLPLDGPGFEDFRPHLLLGILVRTRRRDLVPKSKPLTPASAPERSYTPPLPDASLTPPHPPPDHHSSKKKRRRLASYKPASVVSLSPALDMEDGDAPYSPGGGVDVDEDEPYSPGGDDDGVAELQNSPPADLQKKMEELNREIEEQTQEIQSISCAIGGVPTESIQETVEEGVEEEAYSPSRSFTPPPTENIPFLDSGMSSISLPKNLQEILASIKKVEDSTPAKPMTLKLDPIVQAYSSEPAIEAYSPETKESPPVVDSYIPSAVKADVSEELSQASSSLSKDSSTVIEVAPKVSRDPRQRMEAVKKEVTKSSLSQLSDDDLIKKAAEMGFIDSDKQEEREVVEKVEIEQPLPPGTEAEDYGSQFGVQNQSLPTPFLGFASGPICQTPVSIAPPAIDMSVPPPPIPMHSSLASLAPPVPFPQGFSNPPPPLPPLPPPMPPMPPPLPATTTTIPPFNHPPPLPPPPVPTQNTHLPPESVKPQDLPGPSMSFKDRRNEETKRRRKHSDDSRNDSVKKKPRDSQPGDVWKHELPRDHSEPRDFEPHSSREFEPHSSREFEPHSSRDFEPHSTRGHKNARFPGGQRGFHHRNRGRPFERGGGRGRGMNRDGKGNWERGTFYREYQQRNFSNPPPPSPENIQNEWDEEIRNFEQQRERRQKFSQNTGERHWPKDDGKMRRRRYPPGHE